MKYSTVRPAIKSGDVLAWSHRKLRSWYDFKIMLVRLFTMSEYSHVGLAVVMGGRVWVLEAVTPRIRLVPLSNLLPCYVVSGNKMTKEEINSALDWVGRGDVEYSQIEAIKGYLGKNDRADGAVQCAELVNIILGLPCRDTPSATVAYMLENGSTLTSIQ